MEDYEKFYPVSKGSIAKTESFKKKNGWFCLDKVDEKGKPINRKLYGSGDSQPNRTLAIVLRPCIPI